MVLHFGDCGRERPVEPKLSLQDEVLGRLEVSRKWEDLDAPLEAVGVSVAIYGAPMGIGMQVDGHSMIMATLIISSVRRGWPSARPSPRKQLVESRLDLEVAVEGEHGGRVRAGLSAKRWPRAVGSDR